MLLGEDLESALAQALDNALKLTGKNETMARQLVLQARTLLWERCTWSPDMAPLRAFLSGIVRSLWSTEARRAVTERENELDYLTEVLTLEGADAKSPEQLLVADEEREGARAEAATELEKLKAHFVATGDEVNLDWIRYSLEGIDDLAEMARLSDCKVEDFYRGPGRRRSAPGQEDARPSHVGPHARQAMTRILDRTAQRPMRASPPPPVSDGKPRCAWSTSDPLYVRYHDDEWGRPVHDDRTLFEFLTLEGAQAGLSWITILRKRPAYRAAFCGFDPAKVARYDARRRERLMQDAGIVRNRLKIESTVDNARAFLAVQKEHGSFDAYVWRFVAGRPLVNRPAALSGVPARTDVSDAMSRDLKKRGFRFVGSTICYAFMQACGLVDDHVATCFRAKRAR